MAQLRSCRRCQAEVAADVPEGLCPTCLLRQVIDGRQETEDHPRRSPALAFVPPTPAELAVHFPQLDVLALLGQGGMGAVYKARQKKLDRLVALKILPPEVARDSAFAERFIREARSLARLNHAQIVTVHDFGDVDGLYYFTMEYVDGRNLRNLLHEGPLPPAQARSLALQICDALQYAHDEGLVHRDIKPENILLDRKGRVKIADFGLAKLVGLTPTYLTLTGAHEMMGTLLYMAPEQMKQAHSVDHRADLYSLGVILYEMVTGELPLGRFAPPSRKAGVDERFDEVVLKALAREPAERYQDAAALKQDVEAALAAGPAGAAQGSADARFADARFADARFADARFADARLSDARRPGWPSVRFKLLLGNGAEGPGGLLRRDEHSLILEFETRPKGIWKQFKEFFEGPEAPGEIRIPLLEVATLSYGWGWGKPPYKLLLRVTRLAALAGTPSKHGQVQLFIPREDRNEARRLVKSIGRPGTDNQSEWPGATVARARREVVGPAWGLLLGSVLALLMWVPVWVWILLDLLRLREQGLGLAPPEPGVLAAAFVVVPAALVQGLGAIMMMRLRGYPLAATASILAMIPWSGGAFFITLPMGIWACIVLGKPEVTEAFFSDPSHSPIDEPAGDPDPEPRIVSRVVSYVRSVCGYFLPTMPGRTMKDER
jgi:serine/threonine protein kinase